MSNLHVNTTRQKNFLITILWTGLLVGILDITLAIIYFSIKTDKHFTDIFRYISSAAFGKEKAYAPGNEMIILGALFHFIIAFAFTIFFFLVYKPLNLIKWNNLLTGIAYGIFVWTIMNIVILPIMFMRKISFKWNESTQVNMLILILAMGIPLAFIAYWFYKDKQSSRIATSY